MIAAAVVLGLLAAAVGCSPSVPPLPPRGAIAGKVTLDGKPLAKGNVRFIALDPNGFNVLAAVTDGAYSVAADQGPSKGKYRVEFSVPAAAPRKTPNPDSPGQWLEEPQETLPARFHRDSAVQIDYDPAAGKPHDFDLK